MFKAQLLQLLYGPSDAGMEEATPDHTTLCRFWLKLFADLDRQLEQAGVILKRRTMLDATRIETGAEKPALRRERSRSCLDPDAAFAKRAGNTGFTYGYKAHVGVDQGSGLIRSVIITPADDLIRGDERCVLADAAYHTLARQVRLKAKGIKSRLMRRPNKHHPKANAPA